MSQIRQVPSSSLQQLPGGDTIERHRHRGHQLIYVSTGVLVIQTAHGSWVASGDRAIWIPSQTWHQHRAYGASTIHTIGFEPDEAPLATERPTIVAVGPLLRELLIAASDRELAHEEADRLRAVLRDRLGHTAHEPISLPAPGDPRLAAACALALEDLAAPLSLPALATATGTTERTLSRLFRRQTGMTYPQWRARARALQAMVLLASGVSITDAATRCGWSTTSAFIDSFRRAHGQTPGAYRSLATAQIG